MNRARFFALLGSSGCGKSTLLRMLAGFEAHLGPYPVGRRRRGQPHSRLSGQHDVPVGTLFPHLDLWNDRSGSSAKACPRPIQQPDGQCSTWCNSAPMPNASRAVNRATSNGQVALATGLTKRPKLLLDEPLGALDKKLREQPV
jgi:putrescine transport system ATP-binding protein